MRHFGDSFQRRGNRNPVCRSCDIGFGRFGSVRIRSARRARSIFSAQAVPRRSNKNYPGIPFSTCSMFIFKVHCEKPVCIQMGTSLYQCVGLYMNGEGVQKENLHGKVRIQDRNNSARNWLKLTLKIGPCPLQKSLDTFCVSPFVRSTKVFKISVQIWFLAIMTEQDSFHCIISKLFKPVKERHL